MIKEIRYCDVCGCKIPMERLDNWNCRMSHQLSTWYEWNDFLDLCKDCLEVQMDYFAKVLRAAGFRDKNTKYLTLDERQNHIKNLKELAMEVKE